MEDWLVEYSKSVRFRNLVKGIGLPLPLPRALVRTKSPWKKDVLNKINYLCLNLDGTSTHQINAWLNQLGATEAHSNAKIDALVIYDKRQNNTQTDANLHHQALLELHEKIQPYIQLLRDCAKILFLSDIEPGGSESVAGGIAGALFGFCKSLAKELGGRGITCNQLVAHSNPFNFESIASSLGFFLSPYSAFVTGQRLFLESKLKPTKPFQTQETDGLLSNRIAIVTGAAQGIGRAICERLSCNGASVLAIDLDTQKHHLAKLSQTTQRITPIQLDIRNPNSGKLLREAFAKHFPDKGLDILVHNAGITRDRSFAKMNTDEWRSVLDINLFAPQRLNAEFLSILNPNSRVLFLSSISGIAGNFGQTNYAASKAGLIEYCEDLSISALSRSGITSNCVAPGLIESRMTAKMPFVMREFARRLSALKQGGRVDDVAESICYLALPGSGAINGQCLRVCGLNFIGT